LDIFDRIVELGRSQRALFVRTEPNSAPDRGWHKADHDIQPRHTLISDLTSSEQALLNRMHPKTRYNIRLAERRGVRVRFSDAPKAVESFLRLSRDVAGRGSFHFHPDGYYRELVRILAGSGSGERRAARAEVALAERGESVLAAHILVSFGDVVTYVHGASSSHERHLMAPHLLQWESMRRAKHQGFTHYDFFGVAPPQAGSDHSWAGITRFKEGFGGERVSYVGAYDFVLSRLGYWVYSSARRLRL
jgi:lipid II:glycine glycyltransferase (peptidoglycan interpeptide bridge formation enzyme)